MNVAFNEPESLVARKKEPQRKLRTFKKMQQAIKKLSRSIPTTQVFTV